MTLPAETQETNEAALALSPVKRAAFISAITAATCLLMCGLAELFLLVRGESGDEYAKWHRDSLTFVLDDAAGWALEPRRYPWGQVNRFKFRGPEIPPGKREGTFRIIVLGGSAAFEMWKSDRATWPFMLERSLRRATGRSIEVLNAGTPGYSTWQARRLLEGRLLEWKPDLVLLYELYNDSIAFRHGSRDAIIRGWGLNARANYIGWAAHDNWFFDSLGVVLPRTADVFRMVVLRRQMAETMSPSAAFWRLPGADGTVSPVGFGFYGENLRAIARTLRRERVPLGIVTQATLIREQNSQRELERLRNTYAQRGLNHARLWRAYRDAWALDAQVADELEHVFLVEAHKEIPPTLEYFTDAVHLTARGSERLAGVLSTAVAPVLAREPGSPL